jgi:hypothetical protein
VTCESLSQCRTVREWFDTMEQELVTATRTLHSCAKNQYKYEEKKFENNDFEGAIQPT